MKPGQQPIRIDSLTGLRAIAAWWVVLFHFKAFLKPYIPDLAYGAIANGYLAVDLFFCLSGFVIFLNFGNLDVRNLRETITFYAKRWARIYPLHLVMIGFYIVLIGAVLATRHQVAADRFSAQSLILNLLLVHDWGFSRTLTWNIPSWSISAEFAAYLLFPLIAIAVRRSAGRWIPSILLIAFALCILNLAYWHDDFDLGRSIESLGVVRCVTQFAVGATLAGLFLARREACFRLRAVLWAVAIISGTTGMFLFGSLMIPIACAALILALAVSGWPSFLLANRWLVFGGEISYATYMCHYFCYDVFKYLAVNRNNVASLSSIAITFFAVLALSAALYKLVERPGQTWIVRKAIPAVT